MFLFCIKQDSCALTFASASGPSPHLQFSFYLFSPFPPQCFFPTSPLFVVRRWYFFSCWNLYYISSSALIILPSSCPPIPLQQFVLSCLPFSFCGGIWFCFSPPYSLSPFSLVTPPLGPWCPPPYYFPPISYVISVFPASSAFFLPCFSFSGPCLVSPPTTRASSNLLLFPPFPETPFSPFSYPCQPFFLKGLQRCYLLTNAHPIHCPPPTFPSLFLKRRKVDNFPFLRIW